MKLDRSETAVAGSAHDGAHADRWGRFLAWLGATVVALLLAVAAFNVVVDPQNIYGLSPLPRVAQVMSADKVRLARDYRHPDFVLLGSSVLWKYDPTSVEERTGLVGFNAAVGGVEPSLAFASWFARRSSSRPMPHLVVEVSAESLRPEGGGASVHVVPELSRQFPAAQRLRGTMRGVVAPALSAQTTMASVRLAGRWALRRIDPAMTERWRYEADGFLTYGLFDQRMRHGDTFARAHAGDLQVLRGYYQRTGDALDARACDQFERMLEVANAHGDRPSILIAPVLPGVLEAIDPVGRADRMRVLRRYLRRAHREHEFDLYDYEDADALGIPTTGWYDGRHASREVGDAVLNRLVDDGAFRAAEAAAAQRT